MCSALCDGIGWIRSHFYFLAEHWWRLSRASTVGMLEVCQVTKHTPSPIFIVATDSLDHMQRCTILDWGRGGEHRGRSRAQGEIWLRKSCSSVSLWRPIKIRKGDNTFRALKKNWISAEWTHCWIECYFLSICLSSHTSSFGKCAKGEIWKEIKYPLPQYAYMHRFTDFMTPTPHHLHCQLFLSASIILSLLPFPFSAPKIQSCVCLWWRGALVGFMPDTVEYIKLQEKINKWSNLSVLVSLHRMSIIWLCMPFYLLFFIINAIQCSV